MLLSYIQGSGVRSCLHGQPGDRVVACDGLSRHVAASFGSGAKTSLFPSSTPRVGKQLNEYVRPNVTTSPTVDQKEWTKSKTLPPRTVEEKPNLYSNFPGRKRKKRMDFFTLTRATAKRTLGASRHEGVVLTLTTRPSILRAPKDLGVL